MKTDYILVAPKNRSLYDVLDGMTHSELLCLLHSAMKKSGDGLGSEKLRRLIVAELAKASAHSFNFWSAPPAYDDIVRKVASRLKLPSPPDAEIPEIERAILFKVIEKSIEKMSSTERERLSRKVEHELRGRGIARKVSFNEITGFVKFMAMDVGGSVGGLAFAAPGLSGVVGLNFLQWAVLKGIVLTSGHIAAGTALVGLGTGGALMGAAGAAGPIGAGLALLYTAHVLAGPAYRKLIPAICLIAAKRIEISAS